MTEQQDSQTIKLGRRIRSARKAAHMTQAALAKACGLTRTSVTNIEHGRQQVTTVVLCRLTNVLKVAPSELLDGPSVCCQRFETCTKPCTPRAKHWRDSADALQAEAHDLNRFIARAAVEANTAQRKPLTDEQIYALAEQAFEDYMWERNDDFDRAFARAFARALEAAHGIPAPKGGSDA